MENTKEEENKPDWGGPRRRSGDGGAEEEEEEEEEEQATTNILSCLLRCGVCVLVLLFLGWWCVQKGERPNAKEQKSWSRVD